MNETWWVGSGQLDEGQKEVLLADPQKEFLLLGPPGSGKTNLLMLRANYVKSVAPRMCLLTFTRPLAEFLRTSPSLGRPNQMAADEIRTFMSWAVHLIGVLGSPMPRELNDESASFPVKRAAVARALSHAIDTKQPKPYYDALFVDEVQDFLRVELLCLRRMAVRLTAAGDARQRIWQHREGLPTAVDLLPDPIHLKFHYRVGARICRFADRILPPSAGEPGLAETSRYPELEKPSDVTTIECASEDDAFARCIDRIRTQRRYVLEEPIGVLFRTKAMCDRFWRKLCDVPELSQVAMMQGGGGGDYYQYGESDLIRIMTVHAAKGSEFRAVHMLEAEHYTAVQRELAFTGVTRAKTEVALYHVGRLPGHMTLPRDDLPTIDELF